eukprot:Colp12_sorted_trinity150504_noHs@22008
MKMVKPKSNYPPGSLIKLVISLIIDLIGFSTYLLFGAGEGADVLWAPISAYLIHNLYHNNFLTFTGLFEELLPFTDFIPTATLGWLLESTGKTPSELLKGKRPGSSQD